MSTRDSIYISFSFHYPFRLCLQNNFQVKMSHLLYVLGPQTINFFFSSYILSKVIFRKKSFPFQVDMSQNIKR